MPQPTLNTHVVQTFARKAALICPQHAQDVVALANVPVLSQATTQEAMAQCASVYGAGLALGLVGSALWMAASTGLAKGAAARYLGFS